MTRTILSSFLFAIILASAAPAFAGPGGFENALKVSAEAGSITPHGVWDSK
jgi:hypothetical protein